MKSKRKINDNIDPIRTLIMEKIKTEIKSEYNAKEQVEVISGIVSIRGEKILLYKAEIKDNKVKIVKSEFNDEVKPQQTTSTDEVIL